MNGNRPVALVTGAGTGIGRATALRLARDGAAVAVGHSRSGGEARDTVARIREAGGEAVAVRADVTDDDQVRAMVAETVAAFGGLTWLVNNAAATRAIALRDLDAVTGEVFDELFATNVKGPFFVTRAAAPHLRAAGGAVVNVGSIAGVNGDGSSLPYVSSKAALTGLTKALARSLAPDVRVNCVAPGVVDTRWWQGKEDHMRRLSAHTLLGRITTPRDVADMIAAVLRQPALTGQLVVVDGGQTL